MTFTAPRIDQARISAYQPSRLHAQKRTRGQQWSLGANFNGCLPEGATIASGVFYVQNPGVVILGNATNNGRDCSIECTAGYGWSTVVKCQVTDTNGKVWNQLYLIRVADQPWMYNESAPPSGPYQVTF